MKEVLRKIVISVIILGMIINSTVAYAEQAIEKDEGTECMAIANDCNVIYECDVQSENRSKIRVSIRNDGSEAISSWRLVYNSSAIIESAENVEIILQKDVHELGFTEKNRFIEPACSVSFTMTISYGDDYVSPERFRVYCEVPQEDVDGNSFDECLDCMSYNADNRKMKLEIYDSEEDGGSDVSRSSDLSADDSIAVEKSSVSDEASTYGIINSCS